MEIGFSSKLDLVSDGEYYNGDWFQFNNRTSLSETIIKYIELFLLQLGEHGEGFSSTLDLVSVGDYYNGD